MNKKKPLLAIRPRFDSTLTIIEAVPLAFFLTFTLGMVLATFLYLLFSLIGLTAFIAAGTLYTLVMLGGLLAIPALYFEAKKKAYRRTAYLFYDDHLEYQDFRFHLSRRRGRLGYAEVGDVFERSSALQTQRALTSVFLLIPAMIHRSGTSMPGAFAGIKVRDVPENAGYADKIVYLIQGGGLRDAAQEEPQRTQEQAPEQVQQAQQQQAQQAPQAYYPQTPEFDDLPQEAGQETEQAPQTQQAQE